MQHGNAGAHRRKTSSQDIVITVAVATAVASMVVVIVFLAILAF